jgi:oligopeptide/dipeptide ABC transporter ATP-binding protein
VTPMLLEVAGLSVRYGEFEAVTDASIAIPEGRTLALVGESGSGKSSLALAVGRLLPVGGSITGGSIRVGGVDVAGLRGSELRQARGRLVGYLAQDSMAALNPVLTAGRQVSEVFEAREGVGRRDARAQAVALLTQVGIQRPAEVAGMYAHELSGGMRQRVMIAMALALRPRLLIADEPTTALDVTVQAEILALARELQAEHGVTFLWITHDMGVVAEIADSVAVMYGGRIVEQGPAEAVFERPAHPYTRALISTVRGASEAAPKAPFAAIPGSPPSGVIPSGCPFHPRCEHAFAPCATRMPETTVVSDEHAAACHLLEGVA